MSETAAPPKTETSTHPLAMLDTLLEPFNRPDSPGVMIGIAQHGKLLYRRAVGMASLEHGVAHAPNTRIRIASTSKQFTGFGILLLVEDGLVNLDDKIQKYLPEMPDLHPDGPTVRHLLHHTGGWRGHDELWALSNGVAFHLPGPGLPAMARQTELSFEPGTQMAYSNGGYHMLAKIIERVSGKSFNDFLKERIFVPLDMLDTESVATDLDVVPRMAQSYVQLPDGKWLRGLYPCELDGGGSLVSTVDDLLRWAAHLRADKKIVGNAETWRLMTSPSTLRSGEQVHYGCGLAMHPYRGVDIIHHAGAVFGISSQMLVVPDHGLDIVILANGVPVNPSGLAIKVVETLLADHMKDRAPRAQAADFPSLVNQRYYCRETGSLLGFSELELAGQRMLCMSLEGSGPVPPNHVGDRLWVGIQEASISDFALDVSTLDKQNTPDVLNLTQGGQPRRYERVTRVPTAQELAPQVCGEYFSPALDASATVQLKDDRLTILVQGRFGQLESVMTIFSEDAVSLTPTDPLLSRIGVGLLCFDKVEGQTVEMRIATMRSRNIRFVRKESQA